MAGSGRRLIENTQASDESFLNFRPLLGAIPFRFQTTSACPADPDIQACDLTWKCTLHLLNVHVEACRLHALKRAAAPALEMGMGRVIFVGGESIDQTSAQSAQASHQPFFRQQIQNAIDGDSIDIHRPAESLENLLRAHGRGVASDDFQYAQPVGC